MTKPAHIEDSGLDGDDWTVTDLHGRLIGGSTGDLSQVLRVVSWRLAQDAASVDDPMFVLSDITHTMESLHSAARQILTNHECVDDPQESAALSALASAINDLSEVAYNF